MKIILVDDMGATRVIEADELLKDEFFWPFTDALFSSCGSCGKAVLTDKVSDDDKCPNCGESIFG